MIRGVEIQREPPYHKVSHFIPIQLTNRLLKHHFQNRVFPYKFRLEKSEFMSNHQNSKGKKSF